MKLSRIPLKEIALYLFTLSFFVYWALPVLDFKGKLSFTIINFALLVFMLFAVFWSDRIVSIKKLWKTFRPKGLFEKALLAWAGYCFVSLAIALASNNRTVTVLGDFYFAGHIVIAYFLAAKILTDSKKISRFVGFFLIAGIACSGFELASIYIFRFPAYHASADIFKTGSLLLIFLALFSIFNYLKTSPKPGNFIFSAYFLFAAFVSMSRTVLVSLTVSIAGIFLIIDRKKKSILRFLPVLAVSVILALAFFSATHSIPQVKNRYAGISSADESVLQRLREDSAVVLQSRSSLLFGKGFGADYVTQNKKTGANSKHFIDSNLFGIYYRQGILGLAIFLSLFAIFFHDCAGFVLSKKQKDLNQKYIVMACALFVLAILVSSLALNSFKTAFFMIIIAMAYNLIRGRK